MFGCNAFVLFQMALTQLAFYISYNLFFLQRVTTHSSHLALSNSITQLVEPLILRLPIGRDTQCITARLNCTRATFPFSVIMGETTAHSWFLTTTLCKTPSPIPPTASFTALRRFSSHSVLKSFRGVKLQRLPAAFLRTELNSASSVL